MNEYRVGIDYSTSSPAMCFNVEDDWDIHYLTPVKKLVKETEHKLFWFIGHHLPKFDSQTEKYSFISNWAMERIELYTIDRVYIEDYAYAATGKVFHIGENTGLLKHKLFKKGIQFDVVAPTVVKKNAVGKGNASKHDLIEQFKQETGIDLYKKLDCVTDNPVSDIVDSYFICKYGL